MHVFFLLGGKGPQRPFMSKGVCLFTLLDNISTFALDCLLITFVFHVQDVGMGDKAVTSFLGSCVPLLQIDPHGGDWTIG